MVGMNNREQASSMPVGLLAHQMRVLVGVDVKLFVKTDPAAVHGVDVPRGFGEEIKFVGNEDDGESQSVEDIDEFVLCG